MGVVLLLALLVVYLVALAGYTSVPETAPCQPWRVMTFQCPDPLPEDEQARQRVTIERVLHTAPPRTP